MTNKSGCVQRMPLHPITELIAAELLPLTLQSEQFGLELASTRGTRISGRYNLSGPKALEPLKALDVESGQALA